MIARSEKNRTRQTVIRRFPFEICMLIHGAVIYPVPENDDKRRLRLVDIFGQSLESGRTARVAHNGESERLVRIGCGQRRTYTLEVAEIFRQFRLEGVACHDTGIDLESGRKDIETA